VRGTIAAMAAPDPVELEEPFSLDSQQVEILGRNRLKAAPTGCDYRGAVSTVTFMSASAWRIP
jgi:hypothetical protein